MTKRTLNFIGDEINYITNRLEAMRIEKELFGDEYVISDEQFEDMYIILLGVRKTYIEEYMDLLKVKGDNK